MLSGIILQLMLHWVRAQFCLFEFRPEREMGLGYMAREMKQDDEP